MMMRYGHDIMFSEMCACLGYDPYRNELIMAIAIPVSPLSTSSASSLPRHSYDRSRLHPNRLSHHQRIELETCARGRVKGLRLRQ